MSLSVVVVSWNSGPYLQRLIASLEAMADELTGILVADNASSDGSTEPLREKEGIELLEFGRNIGFAAAANRAISGCSGDFVLLVNPDVEVIPASVRRLHARLENHPEAAIVCGPLVDRQARMQLDFQLRSLPSVWRVLCDVLFLDEVFSLFRRDRVGSAGPQEPVREVEQPAAAFWLLRKRAWEAIGGFDEQFHPAWYEDVDFCKRLAEAGWKIYFYPDCAVRHEGGVAAGQLGFRRFVPIYYGNLLKYLKKHHPYSHPFLWFPVHLGIWARRWVIRR